MRCMDCGREMEFTSGPLTEIYRGDKITVHGIGRYVCECGNDEMAASEVTRLAHILAAEYSKRHDMLRPSEIKALRDSLGLTQQDFESLVGVSKPTVSRWENGASQQTETADKLMKLLRDVPQVRDYLGVRVLNKNENTVRADLFSVVEGGKALKYVDTDASYDAVRLRSEV